MAEAVYSAEHIRVLPAAHTLLGLLDLVRSHPYLLDCRSVQDLRAFVTGWWVARASVGQPPADADEFGAFTEWVRGRFPAGGGRSWAVALASHHAGPQQAWDELFRLLDMWRRERVASEAEPLYGPSDLNKNDESSHLA